MSIRYASRLPSARAHGPLGGQLATHSRLVVKCQTRGQLRERFTEAPAKYRAQAIARELQRAGYAARAHGVRGGNVGWTWYVGYIDMDWVASLVRSCINCDPKGPHVLIAQILAAIELAGAHLPVEEADAAIDAAFRIGGGEAVAQLVEQRHRDLAGAPAIAFAWSFDHLLQEGT